MDTKRSTARVTPRIITCRACEQDRPLKSRSLCSPCYQQHRLAGTLDLFPRQFGISGFARGPAGSRCTIQDCEAFATARGLCGNHYAKERRHIRLGDHALVSGDFTYVIGICSIPGCSTETYARRLCGKHYSRFWTFKAWYGISPEDYFALYETQGGRCGICGHMPADPLGLVVDHDHATGAVRGLLCGHSADKGPTSGCNLGLGSFGDRADLLRKAAEWIDNKGPGAVPTAATHAAVGHSDGGMSQHQLG